MSQSQSEKFAEPRLPSRPKPMNPIFLRRKNALIHGTFVVKPSIRITPLLQHFVNEMSPDVLHNFYAFTDGGAIDVDIWLAGDESLKGSRDNALLKASISLEVQNSKESLVAKLHRPMPRSPLFSLKVKSDTANGMIEIHIPHCFRGSFKVFGTNTQIHLSPAVRVETTLLNVTDDMVLYFIGEVIHEDVLVQKDEMEFHVHNASIVMQFVDDFQGHSSQLSQLDSDSVGNGTATSDVYSGPTSDAQLPSRPKPTNTVMLSRKNDSIKGTYIINPSFRINPILQEYIDQASVVTTNNFQAIVNGGAIDVDIWLVDDSPLSTNAKPHFGQTKVSISLEIQNSSDGVLARIHRPKSVSPSFHLNLKSIDSNGMVVLHFPYSFRGVVKVVGTKNRTHFLDALSDNVTPSCDTEGMLLCFIGEIHEENFQFDEIEVFAQNSSVIMQYVDGDSGRNISSEKPADLFLLDHLASHLENPFVGPGLRLAKACFARIRRGAWEARSRPPTDSDCRNTPLDLRYACLHWASHLSRSSVNEPTLLKAVEVFFSSHVLFWLNTLCLLGHVKNVDHCVQLAKTWLSTSPGHNNRSLELIAQTESFIMTFRDSGRPSYAYLGGEQCFLPPYTVEALSRYLAQQSHFDSIPPSTESGAANITSDNHFGSIFEAQQPSRPWPTNHVSMILRKGQSIRGTFVIKPSLRVSETSAGIADNFHAVVDGGAIDADIWLAGDELLQGHRERSSGETKAAISLTMMNSRDDLVVRLHRPMSLPGPPFVLTVAKANAAIGSIVVELPRSFRGFLKVVGMENQLRFSEAISEAISLPCETNNFSLYFVGESFGNYEDCEFDAVEVIAQNAPIIVQYVDGDPGVVSLDEDVAHQSLLKYLTNNFDVISGQEVQEVDLAKACLKRIERGMEEETWLRPLSGRNNEIVSLDLRYACLHWASHLSQSLRGEPALSAALEAFLSKHVLYWLKVLSLLGYVGKIQRCLQLTKLWLNGLSNQQNALCMQLVADIEHFISTFYEVIDRHPAHIYTCLAFTPTTCAIKQSPISERFRPVLEVLSGSEDEWGLLRTIVSPKGNIGSDLSSSVVTPPPSGPVRKTTRAWNATKNAMSKALKGHKERVIPIVFSPDGACIASASVDGAVHVWNAMIGVKLKTVKGGEGDVVAVTFSPEGVVIVFRSHDNSIHIWRADASTPSKILKGHRRLVTSVVFSHDGTRIASGSADKTVRIWNAETDAVLVTLKGHQSTVTSVSFSPNDVRVVSGSDDKTVRIWDAMTGAMLKVLRGHQSHVNTVVFSPNGMRVASGSDDLIIRIWDASTGTEQNALKGHQGKVNSVVFSPDGARVASGSHDMTVRIWDAATGAALKTLVGHRRHVMSVVFSHDSTRVASESDDMSLCIWIAQTTAVPKVPKGHQGRITSVAFSPDGTLIASGSDDMTVRIWAATTGLESHALVGHESPIATVVFSPNSNYLASGSHSGTVFLWTATTGEFRRLKGCQRDVTSLVFSPDSAYILSQSTSDKVSTWSTTSSSRLKLEYCVMSLVPSPSRMNLTPRPGDITIHIWDRTTNTPLREMSGHISKITSIGFSLDSRYIASASGYNINVWEASTGESIQTLTDSSIVTSIAFSPDGTCIASGSDGACIPLGALKCNDKRIGICVRRIASNGVLFEARQFSVSSIGYSPDGTRISAVCKYGPLHILNTTGYTLLVLIPGRYSLSSLSRVILAVYSSDGERIASASSHSTSSHSTSSYFAPYYSICIWDAVSGAKLFERYQDLLINSIAFSPDGTRIASVSVDGTVRMWNAMTNDTLYTVWQAVAWIQPSGPLVAFSPDGTLVASASDTVKVFDRRTTPFLIIPPEGRVNSPEEREENVQTSNNQRQYRLEGEWILGEGDRKICWVPHGYRGHIQVCHGETLVVGTEDGRVVILQLSL